MTAGLLVTACDGGVASVRDTDDETGTGGSSSTAADVPASTTANEPVDNPMPVPVPDAGTMPVCGNGVLEADEACDGTDFGGHTCLDEGADGGNLRCTEDCRLETCDCTWEDFESECPPEGPPECGNGVMEAGEECDGSDVPVWKDIDGCEGVLGFEARGHLSCFDDCTLDVSTCRWCGDGLLDRDDESCEGEDLGGMTCSDVLNEPATGTLACTDGCSFDTKGCEPTCGNGVLDDDEVCDGENFGETTCADYGAVGGDLGCSSSCSSITPWNCEFCGNGVLDGDEVCDGEAFEQDACADLVAFSEGSPGCTETCTYDLTSCEPSGGALVISEIMPVALPDPVFSPGEWIELHNPGDVPVSFDGCQIMGAASFETDPLPAGGILEPGAYVTLGSGTPEDLGFTPDHLLPPATTFLNVGDVIRIECGGQLVDEVVYDDEEPWPAYGPGQSMAVADDALHSFSNNVGTAWCLSANVYTPGYVGTPGAPNDCP